MQQDIRGFNEHPNSDILLEYDIDPPSGTWVGRLDDYAWGTSSNLLCFFTHMVSGKKYRLSVYDQDGYSPLEMGPAFDEQPLGGIFQITVRKGQGRPPSFSAAKKL